MHPAANAWARRAGALRRLYDLVARMTSSTDLDTVLQRVAEGACELGFEVAVVTVVREDEDLEVAAVVGSDEARRTLLGSVAGRPAWDLALSWGRWYGSVLLQDHREDPSAGPAVRSWIPEARRPNREGVPWDPQDALFAPLHSLDGSLVGVLSVDCPQDGLRPDEGALELLGMFAQQASAALDVARMLARVRSSERAQAVARGRLEAVLAAAPVAIIELDLEGLVRRWNPAAERTFGWREDEVLGSHNPTVDPDTLVRDVPAIAAGAVADRVLVRRRRRDGTQVDVELSNGVIRGEQGQAVGHVGVLADVTDRVRLQGQLRELSVTDPLTGCLNRRGAQEALQARLDGPSAVSLLLVDLDGFKAVNDVHGHAAGDELLAAVAERLRGEAPAGGVVARLGGDEFLLVIDGDEPAGEQLAGRVVEGLAVVTGPDATQVGASVGVAVSTLDGASPSVLLRRADLALYDAKARGRGQWRRYEPALGAASAGRRRLVRDLREALGGGTHLALQWEPVRRLPDGLVVAHEALVGWQHPRLGLVEPQEVLPLAEAHGLVALLDRQVLDLAVRRAAERRTRTHVDVRARSLTPEFAAHVLRLLGEVEVPAARLALELVGSALPDTAATAVLEELHRAGVQVWLGDLGGSSSLDLLARLPLAGAKVGRALLAAAGEGGRGEQVLAGLVALCRSLDLPVVVEGVDDEGRSALVARLGVELVQGSHPPDRPGRAAAC